MNVTAKGNHNRLNNTALLIIDMQNDAMTMVPSGRQIIPSIERVLAICRSNGVPVIHIVRVHRPDGIDVERFRVPMFRESPFLVEGSDGAEIVPELQPLAGEYLIKKTRFSGFFQTDLQGLLTRLGIKKVVICGVQTPNCIRATVTDAIAYDYTVEIPKDATIAQTPQIHEANLSDMQNMGALVTTSDECMSRL